MNRIDRLVKDKKELELKRENLQRKMHERNSAREHKIKKLENAAQKDYENTNKITINIDRKLAKLIREISSEQIYVNEVADAEKKEYVKELKKTNDLKSRIVGETK